MTNTTLKGDTKPSSKDWLYVSLLAAGPVLFLLVLLLPGPESLSVNAQRVAAVAVWMSVWWIAGVIPVGATAIIPFALFPILGVMKGSDAIQCFAHWVVFLMLGGFMLAAAMERWNLHRRIALAVIDTIGVTPRRIVLGFMIATAALSMWISNTSTSLMMLPVAVAVLKKFQEIAGKEVGEKIAPALMLAIAYSASIGGVGTLIGTPPNGVFAAQASELYGQTISFFDWLKVGIPMVIVILPVAWFYLVRIQFPLPARVREGGAEVIKEERRLLGRMSRGEIGVAVIFVLTALGWIFRKPIVIGDFSIPGLATYIPTINSDATIALCAAVLLFAVPVDLKRRECILDMKSALKIPWDILLIFGGGICLADGFIQSGLSAWLGNQLTFMKGCHPYLVVLVCVTLVTFLTEITSNSASSTIFMPIMGALAVGIGQHPFLLMVPCCVAVSMAFMLPVATPPNAVVFGSGYVKIQQMAQTGFVMNLIAITLIFFVSIFLTTHILGIELHNPPEWVLTGN